MQQQRTPSRSSSPRLLRKPQPGQRRGGKEPSSGGARSAFSPQSLAAMGQMNLSASQAWSPNLAASGLDSATELSLDSQSWTISLPTNPVPDSTLMFADTSSSETDPDEDMDDGLEMGVGGALLDQNPSQPSPAGDKPPPPGITTQSGAQLSGVVDPLQHQSILAHEKQQTVFATNVHDPAASDFHSPPAANGLDWNSGMFGHGDGMFGHRIPALKRPRTVGPIQDPLGHLRMYLPDLSIDAILGLTNQATRVPKSPEPGGNAMGKPLPLKFVPFRLEIG